MHAPLRISMGRMIAAVVIATGVFAAPAAAGARSPLGSGDAGVQLGFGATYVAADGSSATHHGLDLAAAEGAEVVAPLAGEVTFVGRVPAAGGVTMLAATIRTAQGSITLLPLDRATVVRGDSVDEGGSVGTVSAGGDGSSAGTHLHMGLRSGSLYLDPTTLLAAPVTTRPDSEEQPETAGEPLGATSGAQAGVPAGAEVAPGISVGAGGEVSALSGAGSGVAVTSGSGAYVTAGAGSGVAGASEVQAAGEVAPGVTLAGSGEPVTGVMQATGVLADAGEVLSTGAKVARIASSAAKDGRLGSAISRGIRVAGRGARTAALLAVGVLCAVGALWPLWRAGGVEGLGKVPVSAIGDDVAAVASR